MKYPNPTDPINYAFPEAMEIWESRIFLGTEVLNKRDIARHYPVDIGVQIHADGTLDSVVVWGNKPGQAYARPLEITDTKLFIPDNRIDSLIITKLYDLAIYPLISKDSIAKAPIERRAIYQHIRDEDLKKNQRFRAIYSN